MRRSVLAGLHCSAFDNSEEEAGLRHRARAARLYMTAETECGHLCPMTMTNASLATLRHAPELFENGRRASCRASYDRNFRPAEEKRGVTLGMGMTEKQGGTDVRANTTRAEEGEDGLYRLTGHKWFFSAPMSDAFLVLAQAKGGLTCFLMPRFLPDGVGQRDPPRAAEGQARQPLERLGRSRVSRRGRVARRRRGARRRDDPRDGDADAARLRGRERRADAKRLRRGRASRPPSRRLRQER